MTFFQFCTLELIVETGTSFATGKTSFFLEAGKLVGLNPISKYEM